MRTQNVSTVTAWDLNYLRDHLQRVDFFIKAYIFDETNKKRPYRDSFFSLQKHISNFMHGKSDARWFMLSGLRGTGKTTLLAQLYDDCKQYDAYRLYLSMDTPAPTIAGDFSSKLSTLVTTYEELIGRVIENLDKPLLIFIDEVQYENNWGLILKNLYDRGRKIFIIATGSQALYLNSNTDIARRAFFEHILPLTFSEYLKIKNIISNTTKINELNVSIKDTLFDSTNAKDLYQHLMSFNKDVMRTLLPIDRFEIHKYLHYGTLPSLLNIDNESLIYEQIRSNLTKIIADVGMLGKFSTETHSKIDALLYLLADSDVKSLEQLSSDIGISKPTLIEVLDILEKTEILERIFPYASHTAQISKSSKYLFISPAFRAMYFNFMGSIHSSHDGGNGKLLEDVVAMYFNLRKDFRNKITAFNYDATKGGADFIISIGKERIVVEIGVGNKGFAQIAKTQQKVTAKYSIVISNDSLHFAKEHNAVRIPIEFFLLL